MRPGAIGQFSSASRTGRHRQRTCSRRLAYYQSRILCALSLFYSSPALPRWRSRNPASCTIPLSRNLTRLVGMRLAAIHTRQAGRHRVVLRTGRQEFRRRSLAGFRDACANASPSLFREVRSRYRDCRNAHGEEPGWRPLFHLVLGSRQHLQQIEL